MTPDARKLTVFVSYSWDSPEHRRWVARIAETLDREPDLHVTFDQFDVWAGRDLTGFMENALACERIIVVCTQAYVRKAVDRIGGVGYESSIISSELASNCSQDKFIPVLVEGTEVPPFLRSRMYVDFREPEAFDIAMKRLLSAIRRQAPVVRPTKRRATASDVSEAIEKTPGAELLVRFEKTDSDLLITLSNEQAYSVGFARLAVDLEDVTTFVIHLGDMPPNTKRQIGLVEAARGLGFDADAIVRHLNSLHSGQGKSSLRQRFVVMHTDVNGCERASAYIFTYDHTDHSIQLQYGSSNLDFGLSEG